MPDDLSFSPTALRTERRVLDEAVWRKSGGCCWYCGQCLLPPIAWKQRTAEQRAALDAIEARNSGKPMREWEPARIDFDYTGLMVIDHLHSRRAGGGDDFSNLVPACWFCNCSKGPRDIEQFRWTLYFKRHGIAPFNPTQRDWLIANGFKFPEDHHRFWFEQAGLEP